MYMVEVLPTFPDLSSDADSNHVKSLQVKRTGKEWYRMRHRLAHDVLRGGGWERCTRVPQLHDSLAVSVS